MTCRCGLSCDLVCMCDVLLLMQIQVKYDHAGKVVKGDPVTPVKVVDHIVFERHLQTPRNTSWKLFSQLPRQLPWADQQKIKKLRLKKSQQPTKLESSEELSISSG